MIILPTVVSSIEVLPSASSILTLTAEWIERVSVSYALNTSSGLLNTLPLPIALAFSLVI